MDKLEKAKEVIRDLSENNYAKLKRSLGVGLYLFNLLKDNVENSYLDLLKDFDRLPIEKRIGILKILEERLKSPTPSFDIDFSNIEKKPLTAFFKPVEELKVLEEKEKKILKAFGIKDLYSALYFVPLRYEDRRLSNSIKTTRSGQKVALKVRVIDTGFDPQEKYPAWVECEDGTGKLFLRFKYKDKRALYGFRKGQEIIVYGKLKEYKGEKYMVHPELLKDAEAGKIIPFYYIRTDGELKSISAKRRHEILRRTLTKLSEYAKYMPEYLPSKLLEKRKLPRIAESLYFVHRPINFSEEELNNFSTPFQRRLVYEDLFLFQLALQVIKSQIKGLPAQALQNPEKNIEEFVKSLPFSLTQAQRKVIGEIVEDIKSQRPMNRLLQGDVGSGKTILLVPV